MYLHAFPTGKFAGRAFEWRIRGEGIRIETRIHLLRAAESRERIYIYAVRNAWSGLRRGRCKFALSASRVSYPRSYLDITAGALTHLAAYRLVHIMLCYSLGLYATRCKNWHRFTGRERRHYQMSQIRIITIRPICIAKDARNFLCI